MKTRRYATPAVKGLKVEGLILSVSRVMIHTCLLHAQMTRRDQFRLEDQIMIYSHGRGAIIGVMLSGRVIE